jgi:hypothetical protein
MTDFEKIELAFDLLEDAEVMQVFDDDVWIKVDREMWNEFNGVEDDEEDDEEDDDEIHSGEDSQDREDC